MGNSWFLFRKMCVLLFVTLAFMPLAHAEDSESDWEYLAEIYMWGAEVSGKTPSGAPVELDFDQILDSLNLGFMGAFGAKKDRWVVFVDMVYLDLDDDSRFAIPDDPNPPVTGKADAELEGYIITPGVGYEFLSNEDVVVTVTLGARYLDLDATLKVRPDDASRLKVKDSLEDWNAVVGSRVRWQLSDRWYVVGYADVGTGDSDITWQAVGQVDYSFGSWSLAAGYRYLKWEFDDGDNDLLSEVDIKGPYAGAFFSF